MTDIDVPDWVVELSLDALDSACANDAGSRVSWYGYTRDDRLECMRSALRAALAAWVVHRGVTYFDTRDSSLPTQVDWNHPEPGAKENVYTLRQEKPE